MYRRYKRTLYGTSAKKNTETLCGALDKLTVKGVLDLISVYRKY